MSVARPAPTAPVRSEHTGGSDERNDNSAARRGSSAEHKGSVEKAGAESRFARVGELIVRTGNRTSTGRAHEAGLGATKAAGD
ncbi:hypothetical protein GCM10010521_02210 [Streptomyces rameus]|uniref:Uncharacterized protein n=1 Tax=Streptomyces rameus TaxID=68261 RepID=A0ABP6ML01_9ACTN